MNAAAITLLKLYKTLLSPLLGPRCRFYPSCSEYALSCFRERPFGEAVRRSTLRLCKCHPWHPGGVDLP